MILATVKSYCHYYSSKRKPARTFSCREAGRIMDIIDNNIYKNNGANCTIKNVEITRQNRAIVLFW